MRRIKYFDLLRVICFCFVILYHMLIQLYINGIRPLEAVAPFFQSANMHIATLAVALFFMLSGAGLTLSAEKGLSLKKYYINRFFRLLIPFYVSNALYYLYTLVINGNLSSIFRAGVPAWKYIFTLAGIDEWLSMHGYGTFSNGIGEWFLGMLIILTVLFPLLYKGMKRWPKGFLALCAGIYVLAGYHFKFSVVEHMNILLKGFEFVLGMYIAKYYQKFPNKWKMTAFPVTIFFAFSLTALNINNALKITISAMAFLILISSFEPLLQKKKLIILEKAQHYSYSLFLIHHLVIYIMTPKFAPYYTGKISIMVFFLVEICIMLILAVIVQFIADKLTAFLKRAWRQKEAVK